MKNREGINNVTSKEKLEGHEEAGKGLGKVIKGTCDSLFNALAALGTYVLAGISKLSEKIGNQDEKILSSKREITSHRLNQGKKSLKRAGKSVVEVVKGGLGAAKGIGRTVFRSGKDTIKGLRGEKETNSKKKLDTKGKN